MNPVIDLILKRSREKSIPNKRNDKEKLGLAIEGGGMRGVISAGMVTALHYLDLLKTFDVVYGTSAGAINGAYFLAGQAPYGTTIYYDSINNEKFINAFRIFSKAPMMSLEYLLDHVAVKEKILDWQGVINSPIPLKVIVSSITQVKSVMLDNFSSKEELFDALKASARIPIIGGPPVKIRNDHFLDGGVFESIPFKKAILDGCTHVLTLLTRPEGIVRKRPSFFEKFLVAKYMAKLSPQLGKAFLQRPGSYDDDVSFLIEKTMNPNSSPYHYAIRLPVGALNINRMEKDRKALVAGAKQGMDIVFGIFTGKQPDNYEVLSPFNDSGHTAGFP